MADLPNQEIDACCFPCCCHYTAMEKTPATKLPAMCYGWWGCSAGPKAFSIKSNSAYSKMKSSSLEFTLRSQAADGDWYSSGEAGAIRCSVSPNPVLCVSLVNFKGTDLGLFNLLSLTLYLPLLCSFLPLANPKYLVFSPFSTLAQYTSAFPPLPMHGSLPLHASPPPILHPFSLVSSAYTIPLAFSFHSLHPHLPFSILSPSVFHPLSLPPANSKPVFPSVLSSSFLP